MSSVSFKLNKVKKNSDEPKQLKVPTDAGNSSPFYFITGSFLVVIAL